MRRVLVAITCITVLLLLSTSACQSTPENAAIGVKTQVTQLPTEDFKRDSFPEEYEEAYTKNTLNIEFDAAIEVPQEESLRIYPTEQKRFTQGDVDRLLESLFGEQPMYELSGAGKDELEAHYIELMARYAKMQAEPEKYEGSPEELQSEIDRVVLQLSEYDETEKQVESSLIKTGAVEFYGGRGKIDGKSAEIRIQNLEDDVLLTLVRGREYVAKATIYPKLSDEAPQNLTMSEEAARAIADEYIERLGATDFVLGGQGTGIEANENRVYPDEFSADIKQAYMFYYVRTVDSIPVTFDIRGRTNGAYGEAYAKSISYERIAVAVDDNGLASIRYQGRISVGGAGAVCKVISFERVVERAKEQLYYTYAPTGAQQGAYANAAPQREAAAGDVVGHEVFIDRITLGYMQVQMADGTMELRPVWDFWGYRVATFESGATQRHEHGDTSLLTLDATNGNVISRDVGY